MNVVTGSGLPVSDSYRGMSIDGSLGQVIESMCEDFLTPFVPYSSLASARRSLVGISCNI